jgi:hypothetical protein
VLKIDNYFSFDFPVLYGAAIILESIQTGSFFYSGNEVWSITMLAPNTESTDDYNTTLYIRNLKPGMYPSWNIWKVSE